MKLNRNTVSAAIFVLTLAVVLLYGQFFRPAAGFTPAADEDGLQFAYEDFSASIRYADVTGLELVDELDLGECLAGQAEGDICYGTWQSDALGRYQLLIYSAVPRYIVVRQGSSTLVFNYESADATAAFFEALQKVLAA